MQRVAAGAGQAVARETLPERLSAFLEVAVQIDSLDRQIKKLIESGELRAILSRYGLWSPAQEELANWDAPPVLTVDYLVGGKALSVFTTIATLGTPQDITLQEVRIECFFPADDRSDALFKSLAAKS